MIDTKERILVAVYRNETDAQHAVEKLSEKGCAMDMLSVLGRAHPSGDDVLGIYYASAGARMKAWARQGALWGALWGMVTGAAALIVLPGVGTVLAAGPIVEAMIAAATHLGTVMHRMGIPHDHLDQLHAAIEQGHYVLLFRQASAEIQPWKSLLQASRPQLLLEFPYTGVKDVI